MHISCTICTELYLSNEETGLTKCGHLFHINCVKPWLQKHKTCPHCRADSSVDDLRRVFFTEISGENVHLNRNCKIDSLAAIVASEKEHVKRIKMDLRQAENDLIDMNKHIKIYENEVINLKILNDSMLENNDKIESENKNLIEKIRFAAITKTHQSSESSECENSNDNQCYDIIELKTINTSLEEENQRNVNEIEYLQKQLNKVVIRNEELEFELYKLKDDMTKKETTTSKEKEQEKQSVEINQKKKFKKVYNGIELKKIEGKTRNESMTKVQLKVDRYLKTMKKKQHVTNLKNNINLEPTRIPSKPTRSESFRIAREQIAKLKCYHLPNTDNNKKSDLNDTIILKNGVEVKTFEEERQEKFDSLITFENNLDTSDKNQENNSLKQNKNECFRKTKDKFASACLLPRTDSAKQVEVSCIHMLNAIKEYKPKRPPMPPPRILKPLPLLPIMTMRAPCPPPRSRSDKLGITFKKELEKSLHSLQIQSRTPVIEHPLTIDNIIRTPPTGSIPLLGLCKTERSKYRRSDESEEELCENEDTSNDNSAVNKVQQKTLTLNESNA